VIYYSGILFSGEDDLVPEEVKVIYESKHGKEEKTFDVFEWSAAMCSHVSIKGEQMVRYYGYYSNVCRGRWQKQNQMLSNCYLKNVLKVHGKYLIFNEI